METNRESYFSKGKTDTHKVLSCFKFFGGTIGFKPIINLVISVRIGASMEDWIGTSCLNFEGLLATE
ncbi:hypothetical protein EPI10_029271 [Gossypium australe]|uniref:Uncharacterized protein n=1 Tax=Gossypium australe TaxID=47621 RepID=A0A5B6V155_9ROSI|nr:hypothetical protein EPI10_029271 [Gossypium australe]